MISKDVELAPLVSTDGEGLGTAKKSPWLLRGLMLIGLVVTVIGISVSIEGCGPATEGETYTLQLSLGDNSPNVTFECTAEHGGLITHLKLGDTNIIIDTPQPPSNIYGSTFWPAPQSSWPGTHHWPPPEMIAEATYDYDNESSSDTRVVLTSQPDESFGIQVKKDFSVDPTRQAFILKYTMEGLNETEVKYAAWEKTSVFAGGLTFWKAGDRAPLHPDFALPTVEEVDGIAYVDHANANITDAGAKVDSNTTSKWIAHATNTTLFMKVFQTVAADEVAPGEGNVEYFARPSFASLVNQGPYTSIKKGNPTTYVVCWYVKPLPNGTSAIKGNKPLLDLVDSIEKLGCPSE